MAPDLWGQRTERDPLEEPPPAACGCDHGWRQVKPAYAEHMVADITDEAERRHRYAAALNTWYPCRNCRPVQFYRWAEGHWLVDHDVSSCEACIEIMGGKRAVRKLEAAIGQGAERMAGRMGRR